MNWSDKNGGVWIFGYGSLVWNPGFEYKRSLIGYIKGFERRFWQGNATQRGTPEKPGRVATLVENERGITWGRAFLLTESSASSSMAYLQQRESNLGGYITTIVDFHPRDSREGPKNGTNFAVLLYIATERNPYFMGPATSDILAEQIANTSGTCGTNIEYVVKLAEFMRLEVPGVWDEHLFSLEKELNRNVGDSRMLVKSNNENTRENTNSKSYAKEYAKEEMDEEQRRLVERGENNNNPSAFSSQVKSRKLKCVNIL